MTFEQLSKKTKKTDLSNELEKSVLKLIPNANYNLRTVGDPITFHCYWDNSTKKRILVEEQSIEEKAKAGLNVIKKWAFWVLQRTTAKNHWSILESSYSLTSQISGLAKSYGATDPGNFSNGIRFNIQRSNYSNYNITNVQIDSLSVAEIEEYYQLQDLKLLYHNISTSSNKIILNQFEIECSECNGDGYSNDENKFKVCKICNGIGFIRY